MEIGSIPELTGINLDNRAPPHAMIGLGLLGRMHHRDLIQDMRLNGTEYMIGRGGLAAAEVPFYQLMSV